MGEADCNLWTAIESVGALVGACGAVWAVFVAREQLKSIAVGSETQNVLLILQLEAQMSEARLRVVELTRQMHDVTPDKVHEVKILIDNALEMWLNCIDRLCSVILTLPNKPVSLSADYSATIRDVADRYGAKIGNGEGQYRHIYGFCKMMAKTDPKWKKYLD